MIEPSIEAGVCSQGSWRTAKDAVEADRTFARQWMSELENARQGDGSLPYGA
jgi:hypothetical protein